MRGSASEHHARKKKRQSVTAVKTQDSRRANAAEREAWLHAQHAEWFATVFKLEMEEKRWRQRLLNVSDQNVVLGESIRKSFAASTIHWQRQPRRRCI
jgi:hypothetical protein